MYFCRYPLCEHLGSTLGRKHQFFASLQWKFDRYLFRELINDMFADRFTVGELGIESKRDLQRLLISVAVFVAMIDVEN